MGVCVVDSGVDPNFPRGLGKQQPYLAKSDKFECVIHSTNRDIKDSELRDGDIITYSYTKGGGHICICRRKAKTCSIQEMVDELLQANPNFRFKYANYIESE